MSGLIHQALTAAVAVAGMSSALSAASDIYIKIQNVLGESTDDKHKGEIDVLAWSWGATQTGAATAGGGGGAGRAKIQDLTITKYVDKASPALFQFVATGMHIPSVQLSVVRLGGKGDRLEYIRIKLTDVLISSVKSSHSAANDNRPVEEVSFNFTAIEYTYTPQTAAGSAGPPVTISYNLKTNQAQ
jgi:type VI secretion system secreted protein Hcp